MNPQPYAAMTDVDLLALCCWREARGESADAKIAQCWSVKNRVNNPSWWGHDWSTVILKPWQYSSFNANDPNSTEWPAETDSSWKQCQQVAEAVYLGNLEDPTNGATNYYDTSISWPKSWGSESEWENTLNVGHFRFWKMKPPADLSVQGDV